MATDDGYDRTRALYDEQRIGGGSAGVGDKVGLLVVDFQLLYTRGRASTGLAAVERTTELLAQARGTGTPTAFAVVGFPPQEEPGDRAWTRKCPGLLEAAVGSEACELDPLLERRNDEPLFVKQVPSALWPGETRVWFTGRGVDTLLIAGTSTSGCVRASVVDGVSYGFRMLVVNECVADRSEPSARAALFDIDTKYGDVIHLADALTILAEQDRRVTA